MVLSLIPVLERFPWHQRFLSDDQLQWEVLDVLYIIPPVLASPRASSCGPCHPDTDSEQRSLQLRQALPLPTLKQRSPNLKTILDRNTRGVTIWHSRGPSVRAIGLSALSVGNRIARQALAASSESPNLLGIVPMPTCRNVLLLACLAATLPAAAQPDCPWCGSDGGVAPASIEGVVDLHVHSAPDSGPRSIGSLQLARIALEAGMRGLLLKNHYAPTAGLAFVVERAVPGIRVFGGIALNSTVGINPVAVDHMARTTGGHGKVVWMPTFDSEHYHRVHRPNPNHVPVSRDGALLPGVLSVLDVISRYGLVLATGHSSPAESIMLIRAAKERGIDRIIVTHPLPPPVAMSVETQQRAAALGAMLEYPVGTALASNSTWSGSEDEKLAAYVTAIRAVGPEHVVISSDLGQSMNPIHTDGLAVFLARLRLAGFTQEEIDRMAKFNPAWLLGL